MTRKLLLHGLSIVLVSITIFSVSSSSFASGSFSQSGGGSLQKPYNHGKMVFHKQVVCDNCPLPNKKVSPKIATEIVSAMDSNKMLMDKLSKDERQAVIYYLNKRYKLK